MKTFNTHESIYKYIAHAFPKDVDYEDRIIISNIYSYIEKYLNMTSFQFERIDMDYFEMDEAMEYPNGSFERTVPFIKLKGDIHFLIISAEKAYNLIMKLYMKLDLKSNCKEVESSIEYKNIKKLRNNLEHMEEKLIQGWRRSKNKMPDVFESSVNWFAHDLASIGDKTFKLEKNSLLLEPESLEHLYSCYDNITNIIYKKYVEPNKNDIDKFWSKFNSNIE